jgi:transcriptional regulator with XRE-family HTH domain
MANKGIESKWLNLIRSKGYTVGELSKKLDITYKQLFELAIGKSRTLTWDKFFELCKLLDISAVAEGIPMFDEDHEKFESMFEDHEKFESMFDDSDVKSAVDAEKKALTLKERLKQSKTPTYADVAATLHVHDNLVYKWFNGHCVPNNQHIEGLSSILGISQARCRSLFLEEYRLKHDGNLPGKRGKKNTFDSQTAIEPLEGESPQDKLYNILRSKGFTTQRSFADAVGINFCQISHYFTGSKLPSSYTLARMNSVLGISADECAALFLEIYKSRHNGEPPHSYGTNSKPIREYKRRKPKDSKVQSEPTHIPEKDIKESLLLEPIIFLRSIHQKTPYEWDKYFYIPQKYHDKVYTAINDYMQKFSSCDSLAISMVIYNHINKHEDPKAIKFSEMTYQDQEEYIFHKLVHSGALINTIGRYFQYLDYVDTSYTETHLLTALSRMYHENHLVSFDTYLIIHNTINAIVEEIRKEA